jgi:hypothetical protein
MAHIRIRYLRELNLKASASIFTAKTKQYRVLALATDFIIVLVTTKDRAEAEKISLDLLKEKLIACANIINPVASCFLWQSKIDHAKNALLL